MKAINLYSVRLLLKQNVNGFKTVGITTDKFQGLDLRSKLDYPSVFAKVGN